MKNIDVLIVGAGPVGLYAGFYAGMRGLTAIIVDQLEVAGGQLSTLYPEKYIYDIAGFPEIKAQDLINNLVRQLKRFDETTKLSLNNSVENITKNEDGNFIVKTNKEDILAKTVIISAGNGAFSPRKLGVENEDTVDNIHYFVSDLSYFHNKKVAIFGGGDSAVDWSLMLAHSSKDISIVHRRNEFRAHDHSVDLLKESTANIYTPFVPHKLIIKNNKVNSIQIKNNEDDSIEEFEVDEIICNYGFISNLGSIKEWNLELDGNKIPVNSKQETNIEGVYAIGDICAYPGKTAMITNGFGEGPIAINSAYKKIFPDAKIGALHSSSIIGE